jgi:hypothetical protein
VSIGEDETMSEALWVRSHVERLLQDEWNVCRVEPDPDGNYPFRRGSASCSVSIMCDDTPPMVRVAASAVTGVRPTAALLRELNEIQLRALSASVCWHDGSVVVFQTLCPVELTRPVLTQAIDAVSGVANDVGLLMAGMFGGATPFPAETPADQEVP